MLLIKTIQSLRTSIEECRSCHLGDEHGGPVAPSGRRSGIMILGEAPGKTEDRIGRPFVGPSGRLLWQTLARYGIERSQCFVANAVCCYPARTPTSDEMYACRGNLYEQIRYCQPFVILALGLVSNRTLTVFDRLADIRGTWYTFPWFSHKNGGDIMVMPTYHPSAVLRDRSKTRIWTRDLRTFAKEVKS